MDFQLQKTVEGALMAFLWSEDFEIAVRNAVSLGGDADTIAAITGSIAEALYGGVPEHIKKEVLRRALYLMSSRMSFQDFPRQYKEKHGPGKMRTRKTRIAFTRP